MENENKITIIIPAYNVEKYIEECIQSVLEQSCSQYECIIVDDGSTDHTMDFIQRLVKGDRRFQVYHQENKGVSVARNEAIAHAKGEYLLFLDSDDLLKRDTIKNVLLDIQDGIPDVVLYPVASYYEEKNSGENNAIIKEREWRLTKSNCTGNMALRDCLYKENFMFAVWQSVVKREYVQENHLEFKANIVHEDELWLMSVIGNAKHVRMGKSSFYLNRAGREGGITQNHNIGKEFDKCTVIDELQNEKISRDLIDEKCAQLVFSLLLNYEKYKNDNLGKKLKTKIEKRIRYLKYSKKKRNQVVWIFCLCFGVNATSRILSCKK